MKRKTPTEARQHGATRRNGARRVVIPPPMPPKRSSELNLTPEEIAMLADPEWVTEDEADGIISTRRHKQGGYIPIEEVLAEDGHSLDD